MSSFTNDLILRTRRGYKEKCVEVPFRYWIFDLHDNRAVITVPAGFWTDGASIPRFLWPFVGTPFESDYLQAAVLHDWMYRNKGLIIVNGNDIDSVVETYGCKVLKRGKGTMAPHYVQFSRRASDILLFESMGVLETKEWKRYTIYYGVRGFGMFSFKDKKDSLFQPTA